MSRYLSALKVSENIAGANLKNLKNLTLPCFLGFLGTLPTPFAANQEENDGRTEVLEAALADPVNAVAGYTAITSERDLATSDGDDLRTCHQCANLRGGVCLVACPGGAVSANRGYRPAANLLQRCNAFKGRGMK